MNTAQTNSQNTPLKGLTSQEAKLRLQKYGPNALTEKKQSTLMKLLGYFWGPIPWMIEIAAILSALVQHWPDFGIIIALLLFNAGVGFWQEYTAGNAVEALKKQLALKARVFRDRQWAEINSQDLVPGDVVRIRLGDIIPADAKLFEGDYLSIDQAALTGESLPVTKRNGDDVFSGTIVKQGEAIAEVTTTGSQTRFGKTAGLVEQASSVSHFQKAVLTIGDYLIYISLMLVLVLVVEQLYLGKPWLELVQFALILTVASIPVALPAVLSMTMAVGAVVLARKKAIVTRLESIEEMASMDILCSDKTGTLTQNILTLGEITLFKAANEQEVLLNGALASKAENQDAIDLAIINGLKDKQSLNQYQQTHFTPFDPVSKRTEANITATNGDSFVVTKGAPQVIIALSQLSEKEKTLLEKTVNKFANQGYRALGVARRRSAEETWQLQGIISIFDPPRKDSALMIQQAKEHSVFVKMVTGDNLAIAKQIAGKLDLGSHIVPAGQLPLDNDGNVLSDNNNMVENADGFAEVFPEHKFGIVKLLQAKNHIVGMTGDGVNDAPALKQADVGIAVSGATDAARAAADLVLTAPGLSVIITAINEARRIFERMNAYAIYRISETIRIMLFVVFAMIFFNFYPITAIMIILLAFFNDIPIMAIAYDHTEPSSKPVRWNMQQVITVATAMGAVGVLGSFGMLILAMNWLKLDVTQVQTFVFLKMAVAGHLVLFVARSKGHFWKRPWPSPILVWSAIITKAAATILAFEGFDLITPISAKAISLIWLYSISSAIITDYVKVAVYKHCNCTLPGHRKFFARVKQRFHGYESSHH